MVWIELIQYFCFPDYSKMIIRDNLYIRENQYIDKKMIHVTETFEKSREGTSPKSTYDHYPDFLGPNRDDTSMSAEKREKKREPVKHPFVVPWQMQND
jgi:hypothetical protein